MINREKKMKMATMAMTALLCVSMAACGAGDDDRISSMPEDAKGAVGASYSAKDVEKRIQKVAEKYDGLYEYDYSFDGVQMSMAAGAVAEAVGAEPDVAYDYAAVDEVSATAAADDVYIDPEPVDWNTEGYNAVKEAGFVSVATQPFSTFGADVDTAAYSNLRRSIYENDGFGISGDAIRIEELINYFSYDYEAPAKGEKFGVTTSLTPCPWNEDTLLLRVGVKAEAISPAGGSNIVFLIDTSGSMFDNNKLPLAQKAFKILQEQLTEEDSVSIVTYAGNEEVILEGAKGSEHDKITEAIDSLEAWGSTNGEGGITKAYEIAEKYFINGGNNRILLATDGDLNVGVSSEAGLIKLVEEKKESGVFLSCLGFGSGNYQDDKMEALADHGNGNYSYIDCSAEAERVLKDELWSTLYTVAKDVKFQIEFNPAQIRGYRQIGYENRAMAAEDFADDSKDGGEVGSGQCVTVLYELVTVDSDYELPGVESRYGNDSAGDADSDELLAVNIRYKEPDEDTSKLLSCVVTEDMIADEMDEDTSWAAGVAQFGMLLRESEYAGSSGYEEIYERLSKTPKLMEDDFRAEFLYLVKQVQER